MADESYPLGTGFPWTGAADSVQCRPEVPHGTGITFVGGQPWFYAEPESVTVSSQAETAACPVRVYVAGPLTAGDPVLNVRAAVQAGQRLLEAGLVPFVPHLSMLWHLVCPNPYETWIKLDLAWLETCDAVLRLPGRSPGVDGEVMRAFELGLPVYMDVDDLLRAWCLGHLVPKGR